MAWDYRSWYKANRKSVLAKKKRKYETDEDYREAVKERSTHDYRRRKRNRIPVDRTVIRSKGGKRYISIGKLAELIDRQTVTIRQYHRKGILPPPTFYDTRGWRLYSQDQARLLRRAFRDLDSGTLDSLGELSTYVNERWEEQ